MYTMYSKKKHFQTSTASLEKFGHELFTKHTSEREIFHYHRLERHFCELLDISMLKMRGQAQYKC